MIEEGSKVQHKEHGVGKVDFVKGDVVYVTFDNGDEGKIPLSELKELEDIKSSILKVFPTILSHYS